MLSPVIAATISNAATFLGVWWLGRDIGWLLLLYGIEGIVVGIFNVKKIQMASAKPKLPQQLFSKCDHKRLNKYEYVN